MAADHGGTTRRLAFLAPLLLALAACTSAGAGASTGVASVDDDGGSGSAGASPSASSSADPDEALLAYAACMREHGIDIPDPQVSGGGGGFVFEVGGERDDLPDFNSEEFQEAEQDCNDHLEGLGMGPGSAPELTEEEQQQMLNYAECMREQGIDMPDPGPNGMVELAQPGDDDNGDAAFDPRSEEFQEANEACREHLPELPDAGESAGPGEGVQE